MRPNRPLAALAALLTLSPAAALAEKPTPGFPEPVVQWTVQKGETCADISRALYGSDKHVALLGRYQRVDCPKPREGATLVAPAKVTQLPVATLKSMNPDVEARPPGGGWGRASVGRSLDKNSGVKTLESGRADIEFVDRTHVFLASNTLVVVYGTASQTAVSKLPPKIELEVGEVAAGLAALRGLSDAVDVNVKGGGSVSAASRDAVIDRKGDRTTVAVFDGKAKVQNGGRSVDVPTNHGTRFVGAAAPAPPRPLPPAPAWESPDKPLVLGPKGLGVAELRWAAVKDAKSYRVEVARDDTFRDLLLRAEVPESVRAFRAEKLPEGRYHVRVRAIDKDEYLGVAATRRLVVVVATDASGVGAGVSGDVVKVHPYGTIALGALSGLEVAVDGGAFEASPGVLDVARLRPSRVSLRAAGLPATEVRVELLPLEAKLALERGVAKVELRDLPEGAFARMRPSLRGVRREGGATALGALPAATAELPAPGLDDLAAVELVDDRGRVLARADVQPGPAKASHPPMHAIQRPNRPGWLGVSEPFVDPSPSGTSPWLPPSGRAGGGLGLVVSSRKDHDATLAGLTYAAAPIGPVTVDVTVLSPALDAPRLDTYVAPGLRWRVASERHVEAGAGLRLWAPLTEGGPSLRLDPSLSVGGAWGEWGFLSSVGARLRAGDPSDRAPVPDVLLYLMLGGWVSPVPAVRIFVVGDVGAFGEGSSPLSGRAGVRGGLELGRKVFGSASGYVGTGDGDPIFMGQLGVGLRQ